LAFFAIPGIAIGLDRLPTPWPGATAKLAKSLLLGTAMLICNLFPSPSGPYVRLQNQRRELMQEAISSLRSLPADSVLLTDAQGSMVLNYYLCDERMTLPFTAEQSLLRFRCGNYYLLTSMAAQSGFDRGSFSELKIKLYFFQSGWIDDKEKDWITELRALGCNPRNFGPNILVCSLRR
jgi:hypothetical protein